MSTRNFCLNNFFHVVKFKIPGFRLEQFSARRSFQFQRPPCKSGTTFIEYDIVFALITLPLCLHFKFVML